MPGPGRGGFGGRGFGGGGRGGPGGWGPNPLGIIARAAGGAVAAAATGAAVHALVGPPPRRAYPPPRPGFVYVVRDGQAYAVRAEEASFIIRKTAIPTYRVADGGEVVYDVQVTMNDGYVYALGRRFSEFDSLRARVHHLLYATMPPFPPRRGVRHVTTGLTQPELEERRNMLQAWLQSLVTAATAASSGLRLPLYDFLETAAYYPPDPSLNEDTACYPEAPLAQVNSSTSTSSGTSVPTATATPVGEAVGSSGSTTRGVSAPPAESPDYSSDGWAVPKSSREASDVSLAMAGPDGAGKLAPGKVAEALKTCTGADQADLRIIWELSDIDGDGKLDRDEFALAWYLAKQAAAGSKPPATLPDNLVPPSKRAKTPASSSNPF